MKINTIKCSCLFVDILSPTMLDCEIFYHEHMIEGLCEYYIGPNDNIF